MARRVLLPVLASLRWLRLRITLRLIPSRLPCTLHMQPDLDASPCMHDRGRSRRINMGTVHVRISQDIAFPLQCKHAGLPEHHARNEDERCDLCRRLPSLLGLLRLILGLLVLLGWLLVPAGVLRLHLSLLCPGQGRRGSRLRPVVAGLLGQQLHIHHQLSKSWCSDAHTDLRTSPWAQQSLLQLMTPLHDAACTHS